MKRLLGFISFWTAFGMLLMLLVSNGFVGILLIALLVLIAYRLFFC